jgi:hypothetical protein
MGNRGGSIDLQEVLGQLPRSGLIVTWPALRSGRFDGIIDGSARQ